MYDMDCDNDDWMDFLKKFTRPLDEVAKPTEDEEQDPEYNILADEEIDEIDKEELRVDKAVKVTRKELNDLIAELFEYSEICTNLTDIDNKTKVGDYNDNSQSELINGSEKSKNEDVTDTSREKTIFPEESVTVNILEYFLEIFFKAEVRDKMRLIIFTIKLMRTYMHLFLIFIIYYILLMIFIICIIYKVSGNYIGIFDFSTHDEMKKVNMNIAYSSMVPKEGFLFYISATVLDIDMNFDIPGVPVVLF